VRTDVEIATTWSRRVHALERIADQVPVLNNYPAYAPFTLKSELRYLYQTYPSVRGKTVFRSKDRLLLTKGIIDGFFDMGIFREEGIITDLLALHDANRGDKLTIGTVHTVFPFDLNLKKNVLRCIRCYFILFACNKK
jgi:hypothetical protein